MMDNSEGHLQSSRSGDYHSTPGFSHSPHGLTRNTRSYGQEPPGIASEKYDRESAPFASDSYDPAKCINCFVLGAELRCVNKNLEITSLKLHQKGMDLEQMNRELLLYKEELSSCHSKIKEMNARILGLESDNKRLKEIKNEEKHAHIINLSSELEAKYSSLTNTISGLEETLKSAAIRTVATSSVAPNDKGVQTDSMSSVSQGLSSEKSDSASSSSSMPPGFLRGGYKVPENTLSSQAEDQPKSIPQREDYGRNDLNKKDIKPNRLPSSYDHGKNLSVESVTKQFSNIPSGSPRHLPPSSQLKNIPQKEDGGRSVWNNRDIRPNRPVRTNASEQSKAVDTEEFHKITRGTPDLESCPNVVKEIKGNLFDMSEDYSLAHCVGSDFIMSSGVAVTFRRKFKSTCKLLAQNKNPGQVAFLKWADRYIYYLVTKSVSTGKPTWEDFEKSVIEWRALMLEHGVKKVAIPTLGCGRDLLDWRRVKNLLNRTFGDKQIEITVCIIDSENPPEKKWKPKLCHFKGPLSQLDPNDCALVFIASKDHGMTDAIKRLATKYGFYSHYCSEQLTVGGLYQFRNKTMDVNAFGLVAKENQSEPLSFSALERSLQDLKRVMKKSNLYYMGIEAFQDPQFSLITRKLWTVITEHFFFEDIEVHFCWPEDAAEKCWEEQKL